MDLDTPEKVAEALGRFVAVTGGIEAVDQLFAASEKVTPQDIMHAAGKYFVPERRTVVVLKGEGGRGKRKAEKGRARQCRARRRNLALAAAHAASPRRRSRFACG